MFKNIVNSCLIIWKVVFIYSNYGGSSFLFCNCGALRDLVPFVQFKKREKHPWSSVNFSKPATLQKLTLFNGCFSRF